MDKQTLRNYGSLAKKVLNYACGREQLTENDREYLKNFCDIQSKFAEELFVRNLVAALLKLEEFKVSKKKPETTRTVPHRITAEQTELRDLLVAHKQNVLEYGELLRSSSLSGEPESADKDSQVFEDVYAKRLEGLPDPRRSLLRVARYCSEKYLDTAGGDLWMTSCFFRVLELEKVWLDILLLNVEYFSRWISDHGIAALVLQACEDAAPQEDHFYGDGQSLSVLVELLAKFISFHGTSSQKACIFSVIERSIRRQLSHFSSLKSTMDEKSIFISILWINFASRTLSHLVKSLEALGKAGTAYTLLFHYFDNLSNVDDFFITDESLISFEMEWLHTLNDFACLENSSTKVSEATSPVGEQRRFFIIVNNIYHQYKELLVQVVQEIPFPTEIINDLISEVILFIGTCFLSNENCLLQITGNSGGVDSLLAQMYAATIEAWNKVYLNSHIYTDLSRLLDFFMHSVIKFVEDFFHTGNSSIGYAHFLAVASIISALLNVLNEMSHHGNERLRAIGLRHKLMVLRFCKLVRRIEFLDLFAKGKLKEAIFYGNFICGYNEQEEFLEIFRSFLYEYISSNSDDRNYAFLVFLLDTTMSAKIVIENDIFTFDQSSVRLVANVDFIDGILDAFISALTICSSSVLLKLAEAENLYLLSSRILQMEEQKVTSTEVDHCEALALLSRKLFVVLKILFANDTAPLTSLYSDRVWSTFIDFLEMEELSDFGKDLLRRIFLAADEQESLVDRSTDFTLAETRKHSHLLFQALLNRFEFYCFQSSFSMEKRTALLQVYVSLFSCLIAESRRVVQKMFRKTRGFEKFKAIFANSDPLLVRSVAIDLLKLFAEIIRSNPKGELELRSCFPANFLVRTLGLCYPEGISAEVVAALLEIVTGTSLEFRDNNDEAPGDTSFVLENNKLSSQDRSDCHVRLVLSGSEILRALFKLIELTSVEIQVALCNFLYKVTYDDSINASVADASEVTHIIIERLFCSPCSGLYWSSSYLRNAYLSCLCAIIRSVVTPSTLKRVFSVPYLLKSRELGALDKQILFDSEVAMFRALLDSFEICRKWPRWFFDFSGNHSGLVSVLSSEGLLRRRDTIWITFWFRREALHRESSLLELHISKDFAVEVFLNELGILCIRVREYNTNVDMFHNSDTEIPSNIWVFLCLRFQRISSGKQTVVDFYLNGKHSSSGALSRNIDNIAAIGFGCSFSWNENKIVPRTSTCLKGQFGAIFCIQGNFDEHIISMLHELGPSFDSDLSDSTLLESTKEPGSLLNLSVLFLYAPRCCGDSRVCPDGSSKTVALKKTMAARLTGSSGESRVCSVNNIIDSLHCIGGLKSVLELFFALDNFSSSSLETNRPEEDTIVAQSLGMNMLICCFLDIISGILRNDKHCEMDWRTKSIFEYLGAWFYDTKLFFSSKDLVTSILNLLENCMERESFVSLFVEHCLSNEFLWSKMTEDVAVHFWEKLCLLDSRLGVHTWLEIIANFDVDSAIVLCRDSRNDRLFKPIIDFLVKEFQMLLSNSEHFTSGEEVLVISGTQQKMGLGELEQIERAYSRVLIDDLMKPACFHALGDKDHNEILKVEHLLHSIRRSLSSLSLHDRIRCFSMLIHQNLIDILLKFLTIPFQFSVVHLSLTQIFDLLEHNSDDCVEWITDHFQLSELSASFEREEWKRYLITGLCQFITRTLLVLGGDSSLPLLFEYLISPEFLGGCLDMHSTNGKARSEVLPLVFMLLVKENNLISRASMVQALVALLEETRLLTKTFLCFELWSSWIINLFQEGSLSTCDKDEAFHSCVSSCKKLIFLIFKQIIEEQGVSLTTFYYVEELVLAAWNLMGSLFAIQVLLWFLQCVKDVAVPLLLSQGILGMTTGSKNTRTLENTNAEGFASLFLFTELVYLIEDEKSHSDEMIHEYLDLKLEICELCIEIIFLLGLLKTPSLSGIRETKASTSEAECYGGYVFPRSSVVNLFRKFESEKSHLAGRSFQKSFQLDEQNFIESICKGGFVRVSLSFIIEAVVVKLKRHEDVSYYESLLSSIGEVRGGLRIDKMWRYYVEQHLISLVSDSIVNASITSEDPDGWKRKLEALLGNLSSNWKQMKPLTQRKSFGLFRAFKSKIVDPNAQSVVSSTSENELASSLMKSEQEWKETGRACMFSAMLDWKNQADHCVRILENISSTLFSSTSVPEGGSEVIVSSVVKKDAKSSYKASEFRKLAFSFRKLLSHQELQKDGTRMRWSLAGTMDTLQRRWLLKPRENMARELSKLLQKVQQLNSPSDCHAEGGIVMSLFDKDLDSAQKQVTQVPTDLAPHLSLPIEDLSNSHSEEKYHKNWSVESPEPASASSSASTPLLTGTELLAARTAASASDVQWSGTCIWVRFLEAVPGRLELRERSIRFLQSPFSEQSEKVLSPGYFLRIPSSEEDVDDIQELTFPLEEIQHLEFRRFLLQQKAFEIFLRNKKSYFFAFQTSRACKTCLKLLSKLLDLPYNRLSPSHNTGGPRSVYAGGAFKFPRCLLDWKTVQSLVADACSRWKRRQLSNFEYLCILNRLAGRSNNDLSQYPIFPWILADYTSEKLDFTDPRTFRDLTKPIGCQPSSSFEERDEREKRFRERFETWTDNTIPPFHYGSHYSSAASVLHFLVRVEPFTTLSLQLQGGLFDHPDRMFYSVEGAWNSVTQSMQDVKELIPEFFYFPEIFRNRNGVSFGKTQDGHLITDVELPKWANGSPEHFVRVHREALESEYVSLNLHHWIDLIFGFRQRGPAAVEACNVFFYLTYERAVDLESIQDVDLRESMETQIAHFGQTPPQLLEDSSHPQRDHSGVALQPSYWTPQGLTAALEFSVAIGTDDRIVQICQAGERILSITKKQQVFRHKWIPLPDLQGSPFTLETETKNISENAASSSQASNFETRSSSEIVGGTHLFTSSLPRLCSLYALTFDGKVIISVGHWDCSIRCCLTSEAHRPIQSLRRHRDLVTCLAVGTDGRTLVTGSKDTTVFVWEIIWGDPERVKESQVGKLERSYSGGESKLGAILKGQGNVTRRRKTKVIEERPKWVLYEHEYPVVCVAVHTEVGVIASNDSCNYLMIHNLSNGHLLRILDFSNENLLDSVAVTCRNEIIMISSKEASCILYTSNGVPLKKQHICSQQSNEKQSSPALTSYTTSVDGRLLFVADELNGVAVYSIWDLNLLYRYLPCPSSPVSALCLTAEESVLLAGLSDGRILAYAVDRFALLQTSTLLGVEGASNPFYGC